MVAAVLVDGAAPVVDRVLASGQIVVGILAPAATRAAVRAMDDADADINAVAVTFGAALRAAHDVDLSAERSGRTRIRPAAAAVRGKSLKLLYR